MGGLEVLDGNWQASALEAAANAIVIADRDGTITWTNPAFTLLTGYTREEVVGQNTRVLKSGRHGPTFYEQMWSTILAGQVWHGEVTNRRKDGSEYTEEMTITPVNGADDTLSHFVAVKQDVTARRHAADALDAAMQAAEAANHAKSEFLACMSHELRTPLNAIIGFTQLMRDEREQPLDDKNARRAEKVWRNSRTLLALIDDILDLSRIEAGELTLSRERIDVAALVEDVVETFQPQIPDMIAVTVELNPDDDGGCTCTGDPDRLRQIINNLLSNAAKFTREGSITVTVAPLADMLAIRVADTGIGIAASQLQAVFQEFYQADASDGRRSGGSGLGLAICRKLCRLMDGEITVASRLGVGSIFEVRLPVAPAPPVLQTGENQASQMR
jgi:PAS domain S-box-containing protein